MKVLSRSKPMNKKQNLSEYVEKLYSAALAKTRDSEISKDIVQETFLAALQHLNSGKEPKNMWNWLYTIMCNKYCDWLREKYNKPQVCFDDFAFDVSYPILSNEDEENLEAIRRELGFLVSTHRDVLVKFYIQNKSLKQISLELNIPIGTVKSRLNTGRNSIRERINNMNNCVRQSYAPDYLSIACSGECGMNNEPFSLVSSKDVLTQNVLIIAYSKPLSEKEIAEALGVPMPFIEPIVDKMIESELMKRTDGGKVYTDFIIYTEDDRKGPLKKQLEIVDKHFEVFWSEAAKGLDELKSMPYYLNCNDATKDNLVLYFLVKLLLNAHIEVRSEITNEKETRWDYPIRKNGGNWLVIANHHSGDLDINKDSDIRKVSVDGEYGMSIKNFLNAKRIELKSYGTDFGRYPHNLLQSEYLQWLYELNENIPFEKSSVKKYVLGSAQSLIDNGIIKQDERLCIDIPVMNRDEYESIINIISKCEQKVVESIRAVLLPVFDNGCVKLPKHLKSVPKWQCYMYCGDSVPMAVILKAQEKGLILQNVRKPIPASIIVVDK